MESGLFRAAQWSSVQCLPSAEMRFLTGFDPGEIQVSLALLPVLPR